MAFHTSLWRRFVKQDQFVLNIALQDVAHSATDICVSALQGELGALIVIKSRRSPALHEMAIPALCDSVLCRELSAMHVGMARFAVLWRPLELDLMRTGESFMAFGATYGPVSPFQREFRL